MLLPRPRAFQTGPRRALEQLDLAAGVERLAVTPDQLRLVIKGVHLAGSTGHEQLDDAPGPGPVVQTAVEVGLAQAERGASEQTVAAQEVRQGDTAQAAPRLPEETAPVE